MFGPKERGFWTQFGGRDCRKDYKHLVVGSSYRVAKSFKDFDGDSITAGDTWVYLGVSFFPYEAGISLFVSFDNEQEWVIRLQDYPESQGEIVDYLSDYFCEF